jgi:LuxR family transcriptional regulator, quorum-sensing system regulator SdiA
MEHRNVFRSIGEDGFHLALGISYHAPKEEIMEMPASWTTHYGRSGMMLDDPLFKWSASNVGFVRLSDFKYRDIAAFAEEARTHGLTHMAAFSVTSEAPYERSFGTIARNDRDFSRKEMDDCLEALQALHQEKSNPPRLTKAEIEALRHLRNGKRMKQISFELGVTEGAIKQRLQSARRKMGATNALQATSIASSFGLL